MLKKSTNYLTLFIFIIILVPHHMLFYELQKTPNKSLQHKAVSSMITMGVLMDPKLRYNVGSIGFYLKLLKLFLKKGNEKRKKNFGFLEL